MISNEFINVNATVLTGYEVPTDTWDSISAMHDAERRHMGVERTVGKTQRYKTIFYRTLINVCRLSK